MRGTKRAHRSPLKGLAAGFMVFLAAVSSVSGDEPTPIGSLDLVWQPVWPLEAAQTPKPVSGPIAEIIVEPDRFVRPTKPRIPEPVAQVRVEGNDQGGTPTGHGLKGLASWYCSPGKPVCHYRYPPGSMVAAACGKLRRAMGSNWRGKVVTVTGPHNSVRVKLVDWCGSETKTIDLYFAVMQKLGGTGVLPVEVRW